jgi:uncharacterized protein (DUF302 family)
MENHSGMISVECKSRSVKSIADKFADLAEANGLKIFARIDHAANAAEAGMELRPTQLIIFGNPKGGTPLMQDRQTSGLDLPFKALVWQNESGLVFLTYNSPSWLSERHGLGDAGSASIQAIEAGMTRSVQIEEGPHQLAASFDDVTFGDLGSRMTLYGLRPILVPTFGLVGECNRRCDCQNAKAPGMAGASESHRQIFTLAFLSRQLD